jgi:undecaprenyl pyrophosphate synthase
VVTHPGAGPAVAFVLDRVTEGASGPATLAEIVAWLFEFGARHVTIVGSTAADPALWSSPKSDAVFAATHICALGEAGEARHFARVDASLSLLPPRSGRAAIVAALAELARTGAGASEGELKAVIERLAGPDPDLILLCGERQRLDDAFTWNAAYAELIFLPAPWSALTREDLARAIAEFTRRDRRFGAIGASETK